MSRTTPPHSPPRARLTALPFSCLRQNGHCVSDAELETAWTTYDRRVPYSTYDVTPLLKHGQNVLGQ
jgi:alpha-L-rhamnosidase